MFLRDSLIPGYQGFILTGYSPQTHNPVVPPDIARRYRVVYASSMAGEIRKNVQLEPGEEVLYWCAIQERANWLLMHPGIVQLTPRRIILLEHHAFSADWILEIPRAAIVNVSSTEDGNDWINVSYSGGTGLETLRIHPLAWRGRPAAETSGVLFGALSACQSGELRQNPIPAPEQNHKAAAADAPSYSNIALFALLCAVLFVRAGIYVANFASEWRAKSAYDESSDCNESHLLAQAELERRGSLPGQASIAAPTNGFCTVQAMTVFRIWSTHSAPYQHVGLADSTGRAYYDIGALNSVNVHRWWRMQTGEKVYVLLAGDQPAWIFHDGDLFETRENPDHKLWEQSLLMLALLAFCGVLSALMLWMLRGTILARRHFEAQDLIFLID